MIEIPAVDRVRRKRFGVTIDANVPMVTQERAYSSPIWYTPGP